MIVTLEYRTDEGTRGFITCPYHHPEQIIHWMVGFCADIHIVNVKAL